MSSRRDRGRTALAAAAVVLAGVLSLSGLATPAEATTGRTISITANPKAAYGGTKITYSGVVTHSGAGYGVKLQRIVSGRWVTVTATVTSKGGAYAIKATLCKNEGIYRFRTVAVPSGNLAVAYSRTVSVKSLGFGGDPGPTCSS